MLRAFVLNESLIFGVRPRASGFAPRSSDLYSLLRGLASTLANTMLSRRLHIKAFVAPQRLLVNHLLIGMFLLSRFGLIIVFQYISSSEGRPELDMPIPL